ncbi:MAG: single-stranded DNA-binding protein [Planctomycetes bacterium]|nr:single-stranded DNA-binding protein [Planctomycetota bacterium]
MASFNKALLMGNLTRDPELRYTPDGKPVCSFGLAVNNFYTTSSGEKKQDTVFIDITVWGKQAENCAEYLKKGRTAFVDGRLEMDTWEGKDGQKRSKIRVVAMSVQFIGGPRSESAGARSTGKSTPASQDGATDAPPEEKEDIPF